MRRFFVIIAVVLSGSAFLWPVVPMVLRDAVSPGDTDSVHADLGMAAELFATLPADSPEVSLASERIVAGIVPHHLVPASSIAEFFSELASSASVPKRIVLLGPNHYEHGKGRVITGRLDWETPFGRASVDREFSDRLIAAGIALEDDSTLDGEHSIFSVIPFIRRFLPDVPIVPLAVSGTLSSEEAISLGKELAMRSDEGTILVGSIDFSHYLPTEESDRKDEETLAAIRSGDIRSIAEFGNDHADSVPALLAVLAYAESRDANPTAPLILRHTNSGVITDNPNAPGTSHFTIAFPTKKEKKGVATGLSAEPIRLLFGGDMMFDRWIRTQMSRNGDMYPIEPLRAAFIGADAVIANLEGPITTNVSVSETSAAGEPDNYIFTFDPAVASLLKTFNVIPSLGNNHILNFKGEGISETEKMLREAGVGFFGSPSGNEGRFLERNFDGYRIAFVNYNEFVWQGRRKAIEDIGMIRGNTDFIVLYAHWGEEYEPVTERQKEFAREFIDAGADIVIGSHPHIVQEYEIYKGKEIRYSLGNLVFDQYFRDDTRNGLLLSVSINPETGGYETREIPVIMEMDGQTHIMNKI